MKIRALIVTAILLAGCAHLAEREHTRTLKLAVQDDHTCRNQGWNDPEPRYISCRMHIDDQRQYKNWQNLQMMHQTQFQNLSSPPPYPYQDKYRPLDPDRYGCRYVTEQGKDYILCGEQTKG